MQIPRIAGVDELAAGWPHEGEAAEVVRALKYGCVTAMVTPMADRLAAVVPTVAVDIVTWVPCSPRRRRDRGFDPAELLARALARRLRLKVRPSLRRVDDQPQTTRDRRGRLAGPRLRAVGRPLAGCVLLVDDVCTTGSTLRVAAATLRARGASAVVAAVATLALPGRAVDGDAAGAPLRATPADAAGAPPGAAATGSKALESAAAGGGATSTMAVSRE